MKQIILTAVVAFLFCVGANAQSPKTNLNSKVEAGRKANGPVLIHTEEGKYKVYASFKKNKVSEYYAIDMDGNKIDATYPVANSSRCYFCISNGGASDRICYEVECDFIPSPKQVAIKSRI